MSNTSVDNLNVASQEVLITPRQLKDEIPLSDSAREVVVQGRDAIRNILRAPSLPILLCWKWSQSQVLAVQQKQ